jgi:hypothetical protein
VPERRLPLSFPSCDTRSDPDATCLAGPARDDLDLDEQPGRQRGADGRSRRVRLAEVLAIDVVVAMSGSNTMCVATVPLETGMVEMQEPETTRRRSSLM